MSEKARPCLVIHGEYQGVGVLEDTYEDTITLFQCFIPSLADFPTSTIRLSTCMYRRSTTSDESGFDQATAQRITFWSHPRAWQAAMSMWDADEMDKLKGGNESLRVLWVEVVESAASATTTLSATTSAMTREEAVRASGAKDGVFIVAPHPQGEMQPVGDGTSAALQNSHSDAGTEDFFTPTPSSELPMILLGHTAPTTPAKQITSPSNSFAWGGTRRRPNPIEPIDGIPLPMTIKTTASTPTTPNGSRPSSMGKRISWVSIIEKPFKNLGYSFQAPVIEVAPARVESNEPSGKSSSSDEELVRFTSSASLGDSKRSSMAELSTAVTSQDTINGLTPILIPAHSTVTLRDHSAPDFVGGNIVPFPRSNSYSNVRSANSSRIDLNDASSAPTTPHRTPTQSRAASFSAAPRPSASRRTSADASDSELRRNSILAPKTELLADGYLENRCVERPALRAVRESNGGARYSYGGGSYVGIAPEVKIHIRPVDEWRSAQTLTLGRYQPIALAFSQYTESKASGKNASCTFIWDGTKLAADGSRTPHDLGIRDSLTIDAYSRRTG